MAHGQWQMQRQRRALAAMSKYSRPNVYKSVSVSSQCLTCRQSVSIAPVPYVICDQLVLINTENDRSPRALIIRLIYCTYCTKLRMFHDIPMPEAKFQPRRVADCCVAVYDFKRIPCRSQGAQPDRFHEKLLCNVTGSSMKAD